MNTIPNCRGSNGRHEEGFGSALDLSSARQPGTDSPPACHSPAEGPQQLSDGSLLPSVREAHAIEPQHPARDSPAAAAAGPDMWAGDGGPATSSRPHLRLESLEAPEPPPAESPQLQPPALRCPSLVRSPTCPWHPLLPEVAASTRTGVALCWLLSTKRPMARPLAQRCSLAGDRWRTASLQPPHRHPPQLRRSRLQPDGLEPAPGERPGRAPRGGFPAGRSLWHVPHRVSQAGPSPSADRMLTVLSPNNGTQRPKTCSGNDDTRANCKRGSHRWTACAGPQKGCEACACVTADTWATHQEAAGTGC